MCLSYTIGKVQRHLNSLSSDKDRFITPSFQRMPDFGEKLFGGVFFRQVTHGKETIYITKNNKLSDKVRIGYKCYEEIDGSLGAIYSYGLKTGRWMDSTLSIIRDKTNNLYTSGFHILWNREEARKYRIYREEMSIYKVAYSDITWFGIDNVDVGLSNFKRQAEYPVQVVVAQRMKILEKVR